MTSEVLGICYWIPNITVFIDFILKASHCLAPNVTVGFAICRKQCQQKMLSIHKINFDLFHIRMVSKKKLGKKKKKKKSRDNRMTVCVSVCMCTKLYIQNCGHIFNFYIPIWIYNNTLNIHWWNWVRAWRKYTKSNCLNESSFYRTMKTITLNYVSKLWKKIYLKKRISVYLLIHTYIMPTLLYFRVLSMCVSMSDNTEIYEHF